MVLCACDVRALTMAMAGRAGTAAARVFSGIQPTGVIHVGNYFGAVRQWVNLQNEIGGEGGSARDPSDASKLDRLYSIVDLHSLTTVPDADTLTRSVRVMGATLAACGLDPEHNTIFAQSHVPYHSELTWILSCVVPLGWLKKMTQFKVKAADLSATSGLFSYPILMAADILIYKATRVPVGEDQMQHLELARNIAQRFNATHGTSIFKLPNALSTQTTKRVMSLRNPSAKMSKSDKNQQATIFLTDTEQDIRKKVMRATTDSDATLSHDREMRPGVSNLLELYAAVKDCEVDEVVHTFHNSGHRVFKEALADALVEHIVPIGEKIQELSKPGNTFVDDVRFTASWSWREEEEGEYRRGEWRQEERRRVTENMMLHDGAKRASRLAAETMKEVREVVGLSMPR